MPPGVLCSGAPREASWRSSRPTRPAIPRFVRSSRSMALRISNWGWDNPTNPRVSDSNQLLVDYLGGTREQAKANFDAASPIEFVDPSSPPTLLLHGTRDELVLAEHMPAALPAARAGEGAPPAAGATLGHPWARCQPRGPWGTDNYLGRGALPGRRLPGHRGQGGVRRARQGGADPLRSAPPAEPVTRVPAHPDSAEERGRGLKGPLPGR